jgi:hypothetical protein
MTQNTIAPTTTRERDQGSYELFSLYGGASDPRDHITVWLTVIEKALGVIADQAVQS